MQNPKLLFVISFLLAFTSQQLMDNKRFSLIMDNDKKSFPSNRIIVMLSMDHSVGHITSCCSPVQIEHVQ